MTVKEFNPIGVTGTGEPEDMFYNMHITGPQGARYELLKESHHTKEDINKAKAWLRHNFDVVKITIIKETKSL